MIHADTLAVDLDSLVADAPYSDRRKIRGAQYIGGAILSTTLDTTHPLSYGLGPTLPVFRQGRHFISRPGQDAAVVSRYADEPLLSGYFPSTARSLADQAASVVTRQHGRGQIILMSENPAYRGFWLGTSRMLLNAIFFAEAL